MVEEEVVAVGVAEEITACVAAVDAVGFVTLAVAATTSGIARLVRPPRCR